MLEDGDPRGLPSHPEPLIGRSEELRRLRDQLLAGGPRLITLTGPPGTGKTRLALAAASELVPRFRDGARFVDLSPVTDAALVVQAIADSLGVRERAGQPLLTSLIDYLRGVEQLLLLDNFEQVLDAAPMIAHLLASCRGVKVLATSRAPLRLRWEQEFPVAPLRLPDPDRTYDLDSLLAVPSVALFVDRARARRPEFGLTRENAGAVAEACMRLDGLPLAIELAASQSRALAPQELVKRLEARLDLLAHGPRDLPERQRTLRGAIGWSYSLLSSDERHLFRGLSVFRGSFDMDAATGVCGAAGPTAFDIGQGIASLAEGSLLHVEDAGRGETRFRLLETLREYGRECLASAGEAHLVGRRHAQYFAALAGASESGLGGPDQGQWLTRMRAEHANLLAALSWAVEREDAGLAAALAGALWRFWWRSGHLSLGRTRVQEVLAMRGLRDLPTARARVLLSGGLLALWQGDFANAEAMLEEVAFASKELGSPELAAYASTFLGRAARDQGKASAARLGKEAVDLFRGTDDAWGLGVALHFLGLAELEADRGAATIHFEESAAVFRRMGARLDLAMPKRGLGLAAYLEGDYAHARSLFEESASLFRPFDDEWSLAMVAHDLGCVAQAQGRDAEAAALLAQSLRSWRRLANTRGVLTALAGLGGVAATAGHASDGACLLGAVGAIRRSAGIALEPTDQATVDRAVLLIQARLSAAAFEKATHEGLTLDLDEAVKRGLRIESLVMPLQAASAARAGCLLTRREREVAALLPLGMTNREIAASLVISEGTAGLHVKHILARLGFSSRAQAAAWAVENGLASSGVAREKDGPAPGNPGA